MGYKLPFLDFIYFISGQPLSSKSIITKVDPIQPSFAVIENNIMKTFIDEYIEQGMQKGMDKGKN